IGFTHGHYECRALDETLPIFTDLLAMQVLERGKGQAVVRHPNTSWRLVVHEGGPDAPDKPHNNHYGVRVARPAEVDAAHEYLEANKARYGLKRVSRPSAQHFARSIYFSEPGGNTLEIEYYDPQAAAEGRGIAAPHWQRELAESDFPGRGYVPQALTPGTLECHDKDASAAFYRDVLGLQIAGGGRISVYQAPRHAVVPRGAADAQAQEAAAAGEPVHADAGLCGRCRKGPPRARLQGHRAASDRARRGMYLVPFLRSRP